METHSSVMIAIVGGSGAGKTWLANRLQLLLGGIAGRLSLDNFHLDRSHLPPSRRDRINYDVPGAIDWRAFEHVLSNYRTGKPVPVPRYDFVTQCRLSDRVPLAPQPVTIVDGLWLTLRRDVRASFHYRIFLSCPVGLRRQRFIEKQVTERGRTPADARLHFQRRVQPMHRRYVENQRRWADLVIEMPPRQDSILELAEVTWALLKSNSSLPPWLRATFRAELLGLLKQEFR